jgi:hypothetical protein
MVTIFFVFIVVFVEAVGHHEGRGRRRGRGQGAGGLVPRRLAQQEAQLEPKGPPRGAAPAPHLDADAVEAGGDGALDVGLAGSQEGAGAQDEPRSAELDFDDRGRALGERAVFFFLSYLFIIIL